MEAGHRAFRRELELIRAVLFDSAIHRILRAHEHMKSETGKCWSIFQSMQGFRVWTPFFYRNEWLRFRVVHAPHASEVGVFGNRVN